MMKYYFREITKRVPINRFGKLGFKKYMEVVLTDDIDKFNYHKRIKFEEMGLQYLEEYKNIEENKIYEYEKEW